MGTLAHISFLHIWELPKIVELIQLTQTATCALRDVSPRRVTEEAVHLSQKWLCQKEMDPV